MPTAKAPSKEKIALSAWARSPLAGQKVVLPGEQGDALARQAEESGEIEIADVIWQELTTFVEA